MANVNSIASYAFNPSNQVPKRRKLHVWPSDDRNGAIIDLTEFSIPEKVMTIAIVIVITSLRSGTKC
jgi:hypothetical protein